MAIDWAKYLKSFKVSQDWTLRPGQLRALKFIESSDKKVSVLCSPTGSGKSLIGMVLGAYSHGVTYLCSSKYLQDQIAHDFPEAKTIKGRSNYRCLYKTNFTAAECIFSRNKRHCPEYQNCPYERQKRLVLSSQYRILNYHYLISEANYVGRFSRQNLIVCDEADTLETVLADHVSLKFSERILNDLGISLPKYKAPNKDHKLTDWRDWAEDAYVLAATYHADLEEELKHDLDPDPADIKRADRIGTVVTKLNLFLKYVDKTWIYEEGSTRFGKTYKFSPTWLPAEFTQQYFWSHGERFICMSGTFPPTRILSRLWGLSFKEMDYLEVESTFPENLPELLNLIRRILHKHQNQRGLIHTHSWKLNKAVMSIGDRRLITHDAKNKTEQVHKFMGRKDGVFVSPSSMRGIDLPDNLCRFIVVCKMPYLHLKDKLVNARLYSGTVGQTWYSSDAAQSIVQATGRGVRHEKDWAVTYILDRHVIKSICKLRSLWPGYFLEAVEW